MRFIHDLAQLQSGLFTIYQARYGAQTALNINFIPDLLQHIKKQLTSQELIRLQGYHLQNYLMELSINYKQTRTLDALTLTILSHIRNNNNFWYRHNNQQQIDQEQQLKHHAIVRYHKDMEYLTRAFADVDNRFPFTPSYKRKTTETYTFQLLHNNTEPHFGTRQPINQIAYIPSFFVEKFQQKGYEISLPLSQNQSREIHEQGRGKKSTQEEISKPYQLEQQRKILQQCIVFLLSNKTDTLSIPTQPSPQPKDNSEEVEDQAEKSQSQNEEEDDNKISEPQQITILDEFLEFVENQPSLAKFPNSHHMHVLTYNLINICKKVSELHSTPRIQKNSEESSQVTILADSSPIKSMSLAPQLKQTLSVIAQRYLNESQVESVCLHFLVHWETQLKDIANELRNRQEASLTQLKGWLNSSEQIARVKKQYQQMLDHPQFVQLTKYRALGTGIPWKQEDYLKFLKGLNEYLNIPTNNKKIASSMGDGFQPNHVKHIKGVYLTVMKQRMDRGQCGGGKRGKSLSKSDFIQKDINNFSMRWFQKAKKIKKRKPKRKRRNSDSQEGEQEPDSQY